MAIPLFPEFAPLAMEFRAQMNEELSLAPDGVSEFTFGGLYLFRNRYRYKVSALEDKTLIVSGIQPPHGSVEKEMSFFSTPCRFPGPDVLIELFKTHDYWKNIPESILENERARLEQLGVLIEEDMDNSDYLYLRTDLALLQGKKYHKKRNLVAQFLKLYNHEEKPLVAELVGDAIKVLEKWRLEKGEIGDYVACREALEHFDELGMSGLLFYVDGKPVGWCLGEPVARGKFFAVHFEKGLDGYKGIYQFINRSFAASLPESFTHINREQDIGDLGIRQAKMTYRPSGFVRKYTGKMTVTSR